MSRKIAFTSYPNRAACSSRTARISAMIGSAFLGSIVARHEFVRCTDHRGLEARLPACPPDSHPHRGIGDVPEVSSYQNIDSVREGNGNVGGGVRRGARDGLHVNRAFGGFGRVDNGGSIEINRPCSISIPESGIRPDCAIERAITGLVLDFAARRLVADRNVAQHCAALRTGVSNCRKSAIDCCCLGFSMCLCSAS